MSNRAFDVEMAALGESLERRFRVVATDVVVGAETLTIMHPASAEELIDEADFERDERLPYWADLWPSARVLATHVVSMDGARRALLELGCGAGLVTVAAARAGFRVTASDYYDDAIRFARWNAWRAGERTEGRALDWRSLPAELPTFDVVIASDVLYERPYGPLVAQVIARALAPNGIAWITDPGRVGREGFLEALEEHGLILRSKTEVPFVEGEIRQTIALFEIERTT